MKREEYEKKYSVVTNPPFEVGDNSARQSNAQEYILKSRENPLDHYNTIKEGSLEVPKIMATPELFSRKLP